MKINDYDSIIRIFYQIANGLKHINELDFVMNNLEPKNILIDDNLNVKLYNYGLFHQTNHGELVAFPIGYVLICKQQYLIKL